MPTDISRRRFIRLLAGGGAALTLPRVAFGANGAGDTRPNIVLIMVDDMGFSDIGCYGSEISTPNLDRLAAGGLRFTHFYNGARCCPTRASLLTGLYAHQAGVGHMVGDRSEQMGPGYQGYLNDSCVTIAEALRPGGYRTLMSGKWHVGERRPHWPLDRGFEKYFGLISGGSNYFKLDGNRQMARGNEPYKPPEEGFYITDAFTDAAVEFIGKYGRGPEPPLSPGGSGRPRPKGQGPFFLYLAYTAPHWPLHAHPEDIAKYKGKYMMGWDELRAQRHERMIDMGLVDAKWPITPRDGRAPAWADAEHKEWFDMRMAVYAAQIERMDYGVGRVMAKLREVGAEQNTLVMFLSDNGGCAEEIKGNDPNVMPGGEDTFMSCGLPWANASNTPFRRYKHWVHEGGIATPFIAYWPAVIKANTMTQQAGHIIDVMATCLDVGTADYPETHDGRRITPLEGKSLLPIYRGRQREGHEALFWEHEGNRAVLQGKWKLVSMHPGGWELFDIEADRTEVNDLAAKQPDKVRELAARYDQWAQRRGVSPWSRKKK